MLKCALQNQLQVAPEHQCCPVPHQERSEGRRARATSSVPWLAPMHRLSRLWASTAFALGLPPQLSAHHRRGCTSRDIHLMRHNGVVLWSRGRDSVLVSWWGSAHVSALVALVPLAVKPAALSRRAPLRIFVSSAPFRSHLAFSSPGRLRASPPFSLRASCFWRCWARALMTSKRAARRSYNVHVHVHVPTRGQSSKLGTMATSRVPRKLVDGGPPWREEWITFWDLSI